MWARHSTSSDYPWHAVRVIAGGSVQTFCRGRWSTHDDYETTTLPARADRCSTCITNAGDVLAGLDELVEATQPVTFVEFEMIDDRFDNGGEA